MFQIGIRRLISKPDYRLHRLKILYPPASRKSWGCPSSLHCWPWLSYPLRNVPDRNPTPHFEPRLSTSSVKDPLPASVKKKLGLPILAALLALAQLSAQKCSRSESDASFRTPIIDFIG